MAMAHAAKSGSKASEQSALRQVTARLTEQFPELSAEEIDRAVHGQYTTFDQSPVRDFVPVLVERATRQQLSTDQVPPAG